MRASDLRRCPFRKVMPHASTSGGTERQGEYQLKHRAYALMAAGSLPASGSRCSGNRILPPDRPLSRGRDRTRHGVRGDGAGPRGSATGDAEGRAGG